MIIYRSMISTWVLSLSLCVGCSHFRAHDGRPLQDFKSKNGSYFPVFVKKFFPSATIFEKEYSVIPIAKHNLKLIEVLPLTKNKNYQNEANLSWSADGVYLSYEIEEKNTRKIMVKNLIGDFSKTLALIPKDSGSFMRSLLRGNTKSFNSGLSWSQGSTKYAFMSNGGRGEYNIYVGAIGSKEYPIAESPTKDGFATWSPSSNELSFVSARSGKGDIYMINLENKKLKNLTNSEGIDVFPEWSPDGNHIIYSSAATHKHDLMIISRKSKDSPWQKARRLTKWPYDDLRPKISPDGRYISFYSNSGRKGSQRYWNIHVIPFSTKPHLFKGFELKKTIVARNVILDLNTGPSWTPDSRKILYVKNDPQLYNPICAYEMFNGRRFRLATNTKMNRDILISKLGIMSFRAQVGAWEKVFVALTNQGIQLQGKRKTKGMIHYLDWQYRG